MASLMDLFVQISGDNSNFKKSMQESSDVLEAFGNMAEEIGLQVAGGLSFAGLAGMAASAAKAFEDASITIQRATGASGDSLFGLEESFRGLYSQTAQSSESVAAALSQISIRTGATGASLEALTLSALRFATVTGQDVKSSVDENQKLFAQWSVSTRDQSAAMDMLLVASQKSGASAAQLSQEMVTMGPVLRDFGMSFQESLAFIGSFAKAGIDASDMMRGLNKVLQDASASGSNAHTMLATLIERMQAASTTADALNIAVGAGFGRSAALMVDGIRNGTVNLQQFADLLSKSEGATQKTADATRTLTGEMAKLGHAMADTFNQPGSAALEWLKDVTQQMNEIVKRGGFQALFGGGAAASAALSDPIARAVASASATTSPKVPSDLNAPQPGGGGASLVTAADPNNIGGKATPFAEMSNEAAVLVEQEKLLVQQHEATIRAIAGSGMSPDQFWTAKYEKAVEDISRADQAMVPPALAAQKDLGNGVDAINKTLDKLGGNVTVISQLEDAFKELGLMSVTDLNRQAAAANDAYSRIKTSGVATAREIGDAWMKMELIQLEADHATGVVDDQLYAQRKKNIQDTLSAEQGSAAKQKTIAEQVAADTTKLTNSMFNSMEKGLAADIIKWKGFGQTIEDVFTKMGEDVLSIMLHALLKPLETLFSQVLTELASKMLGFLSTGQAAASTADAAQVTGQAAITGAAAFASVMASMPFPFNVAMAPGVAATEVAAVEASFLPMALFSQGGDVVDDTPGFFNKSEMVLPPDIAVPLRGMVRAGGFGGGAVAFHNCQFGQNSMDQVVRQLRKAGARI